VSEVDLLQNRKPIPSVSHRRRSVGSRCICFDQNLRKIRGSRLRVPFSQLASVATLSCCQLHGTRSGTASNSCRHSRLFASRSSSFLQPYIHLCVSWFATQAQHSSSRASRRDISYPSFAHHQHRTNLPTLSLHSAIHLQLPSESSLFWSPVSSLLPLATELLCTIR
jgi:hypothetical protein